MVSAEDLKKDAMWFDAVDRLELMNAHYKDRWMVLANRGLDVKIVVNDEDETVRRVELDETELNMVKRIEKERSFICYYIIQDEGMWPDGCKFPRYTLLYVDENEEEYEGIRESLEQLGTVPAFVVNMEDGSCSELTEICYGNVEGLIVNLS